MADLHARPAWAIDRDELLARLKVRYAGAEAGDRVGGPLNALVVAGQLGDLRPDRVTTPTRETLRERVGTLADVDVALGDLVAVGHNLPPARRQAGWRVHVREDVPGMLPLGLARRLVVALETQRAGPVDHRDRWGPYTATETPPMGAVELLAGLTAMRAQLGFTNTVGRWLLLSDRQAWAMLRGPARRSGPSQNERRLLWDRLGVLRRTRVRMDVEAHRKDSHRNEAYAYDGGLIEQVLVRGPQGDWVPHGGEASRAGGVVDDDAAPPAGPGSGPQWAVVLAPEFEAALDAHPVYLSRAVLRGAPAAAEKRLYVDQQAALGPAFNTTLKPSSTQPKRELSWYDAAPVYRALGLRDRDHGRRQRRLKAAVAWIGHNCELYGDPTWEPHRGADGEVLLERDPACGGRARALLRFGLSRDPRAGTGLCAQVDRRPVAQRVRDPALSNDEEVSAAKRARAVNTRRRRERTAREVAHHLKHQERRGAPRRDTRAQPPRGGGHRGGEDDDAAAEAAA